MRFKGFDGTRLELKKTTDGGHDHMEIIKDGEVQWYFHIFDNKIYVFPGYAPRKDILLLSFDGGMVGLTKEQDGK